MPPVGQWQQAEPTGYVSESLVGTEQQQDVAGLEFELADIVAKALALA